VAGGSFVLEKPDLSTIDGDGLVVASLLGCFLTTKFGNGGSRWKPRERDDVRTMSFCGGCSSIPRIRTGDCDFPLRAFRPVEWSRLLELHSQFYSRTGK
jgi:hypothetical protein